MVIRSAALFVSLALMVSGAAMAAPAADPYAGVLNGMASFGELENAAELMEQKHCTADACQALRDMSDAFDLLQTRDKPNLMTRFHPERFSVWAFHIRIDRLIIRAHPQRREFYCAILTKLGRHFQLGGQQQDDDRWLVKLMTEMAIRVSKPSFDCIGRVMASLPDTEQVAEMITDAQQSCKNYLYERCAAIQRR